MRRGGGGWTAERDPAGLHSGRDTGGTGVTLVANAWAEKGGQ